VLPRLARSVTQVVIVTVGTVGPMVAAQITPKVLNGIQLRAVRRQWNQREIRRLPKFPCSMKTGLIPEHHDMHLRIHFLGKLLKKTIDHVSVQVRGE